MRRTLYLGTDPSHFVTESEVIHFPVIQIVARSLENAQLSAAYADLSLYTHLIFTSKNAVSVFVHHLAQLGVEKTELSHSCIVSIGKATSARLKASGLVPHYVAEESTQEGVIALLRTLPLQGAYIFLPRSSRSRPALLQFFEHQKIRYIACDLYDTLTHSVHPLPNLKKIDEIIFTSPSTVSAFIDIFGPLPRDKKLIAIGPITQDVLYTNEQKS